MKSLVYATALAIGSLGNISAHDKAPIFHDGIMDTIFSEEYNEIGLNDLPDAVMNSFEQSFSNVSILNAYMNDDYNFKLELLVEDEVVELYVDADGNWFDM
ncbi:hypothetical protein KO500_04105 [Cellulophaga baltica]|uniref:hypothetical protein n=1 Tax=Cellulophaga TaxID=104264 RepID=UPI001C06829F|nr:MULTISPECIES: hypothetical protein [Cellulophaga]MBU2995598.1 hypothetical protein [Cellulophaga baltica]MDO6766992.1 hypothetical protein [Cellulophaga sp. 1_MG-2023]